MGATARLTRVTWQAYTSGRATARPVTVWLVTSLSDDWMTYKHQVVKFGTRQTYHSASSSLAEAEMLAGFVITWYTKPRPREVSVPFLLSP